MIGVVGMGFVGLTTSVGLALKGHTVLGYDKDRNKVDQISRGIVPFYEDDFDKALSQVLGEKFQVVDRLEKLTRKSDVIFICVGTPSTPEGISLSSLYDSIQQIIGLLDNYTVLVIKSTVPPGVSMEIARMMEERGLFAGKQIGLVNNPEFLREGIALKDFLEPGRIVIGEYDKRGGDIVERVYESFDASIWRVSLTTAEFVKYLSNTLLSTMISFSNEMATFAEALGDGDIDVKTAYKILHQDGRWYGNPAPMISYVWPGCGFGGYCLPKDTYAMIKRGENLGLEMKLLKAVLEINSYRKKHLVDLMERRLGGIKGKTVAVLGLSFKPDTDDVRDTPSAGIIQELIERGAEVIAYDPLANGNFRESYDFRIDYTDSAEEAIKSADGVFIATAWKDFRGIGEVFPEKVIVDGRYL